MILRSHEVERIIRQGVPDADQRNLKVEKITQNGAVVRFPFHASSLRHGGTISGPVIMSLADAAMYAAILGHLGREEMAVTSQMNIHFLSRPEPDDLLAEAEFLKFGKRLVVLDVRLFSGVRHKLVAIATGTYVLPSKEAPSRA